MPNHCIILWFYEFKLQFYKTHAQHVSFLTEVDTKSSLCVTLRPSILLPFTLDKKDVSSWQKMDKSQSRFLLTPSFWLYIANSLLSKWLCIFNYWHIALLATVRISDGIYGYYPLSILGLVAYAWKPIPEIWFLLHC